MRFHAKGAAGGAFAALGKIALAAKALLRGVLALRAGAAGSAGALRPALGAAGVACRGVAFRAREAAIFHAHQQPVAQLFAQHLALHLDDIAGLHLIEPERPVADADQPVHRHAHLGHRAANLAVLALADAHGQPGVGALLAVEADLHRLEILALDGDALAQRVEGFGAGPPVHPHAVFAQPAGFGQLEPPFQPAVVGQQQQPFGVEVEPPDIENPRHPLGHLVKDGAAALFVLLGRHKAQGLVIKPQTGFLRGVDRLAVDRHLVGRAHIERGGLDLLAVHADASGQDHLFRIPPRGDAGTGDHLGDAFRISCRFGRHFGCRRGNGSGGVGEIGHVLSFWGRGRAIIAGEGVPLHLSRGLGKRLDGGRFAGDEGV